MHEAFWGKDRNLLMKSPKPFDEKIEAF